MKKAIVGLVAPFTTTGHAAKQVALLVALMMGLGVGELYAVGSQPLSVLVKVQKISVSISPASIDFNTVAEGYKGIHGTTVVVTNDGNIAESMKLDGGSAPGGWTKVANDDPSTDQYDIRALFAGDLGGLALADFTLTDDTLTGAPVTADADKFARAADSSGVKGYNIASIATRNLFVEFRAPSANTQTDQKTITVTVTAQVY